MDLIISCPKARQQGTGPWKYRRWVTHTVLPSIHRTGEYRLEINRLTAEVAALTIQRDTQTTEVAAVTLQRDSVIRCVEVSPFKLLVARITGEPYANNWKRAGGRAVCENVYRVWAIAKEQNWVEKLTPDACWSFTNTTRRDMWNAYIQLLM